MVSAKAIFLGITLLAMAREAQAQAQDGTETIAVYGSDDFDSYAYGYPTEAPPQAYAHPEVYDAKAYALPQTYDEKAYAHPDAYVHHQDDKAFANDRYVDSVPHFYNGSAFHSHSRYDNGNAVTNDN
ncbi:hypothetical protein SDRG_04982 [Saprolegnia diclina VS20]|uniref:Uncharacterized protein n=1 Tax=Saprolegnia diclina (strain VS20) TaxID=1156394 RepID=T0RXJ9_SAPDV|nr:hypothetical protein SDRG_04982 [Saprolegnia diclina VS20]EQC37378.1 hypothetical protein SDRG_04982 [Saprolegnia diclina VS20]|eukprot:XP_008608898.1 hypothetical protein SDRG_04982 [Saprolegnia diclina VS20]